MMTKLVEEKLVLEDNIMFFFNKYILWYTYSKKLIQRFSEMELTRNKLRDFIVLLQYIHKKENPKLKYSVDYRVHPDGLELVIKNDLYDISMVLENEIVSIEYLVLESNTRYIYNLEYTGQYRNKMYTQLNENINGMINEITYTLGKSYTLA